MRKIYMLTIVAACTSFVSNAQITKGSTFLGGSVYVSNYSNKDDASPLNESKTMSWGMVPEFGKAIATNKILGVFLNYRYLKNEAKSRVDTSNETHGSSYETGIFFRNYFPLSSRFYLFGEATAAVTFGKTETIQNKIILGKSNDIGASVAISPGLSFAASKKLHLETSLNNLFAIAYQSTKAKDYNTTGTVIRSASGKQFNAAANANGFSTLSIGLRWILPSKQ